MTVVAKLGRDAPLELLDNECREVARGLLFAAEYFEQIGGGEVVGDRGVRIDMPGSQLAR